MKLAIRTFSTRGACLAAAAVLAPLFLAGCGGMGVATQADLDPLRSDIHVLEKQFVKVQKAAMEAKYNGQGAGQAAGAQATPPGLESRLTELEKRMDGLEAQIKELKRTQGVAAPQPMAPEPVRIEPIEEAPRPAR